MKNWKVDFLQKALLGQETDTKNSNEVILKCIELAYKDMMTAGRYYSKQFQSTRNKICTETERILRDNDFMFSRDLISKVSLLFADNKKIGEGNKYVTSYGLSQKLVNMTFKYLYIFSDCIFEDGTTPDFSNCDCPLDSIILEAAEIKDNVWSKATPEWYDECQHKISELLKQKELDDALNSLGNLAFDFLKW